METYALKVDDASAVASPPHAHKQVSVPGVAEWSALVSAEQRQATPTHAITRATKEDQSEVLRSYRLLTHARTHTHTHSVVRNEEISCQR